MKYFFIAAILSCLLTITTAQTKEHINPNGVNKPKTYSQVVKVYKGTTIYTSGIVADDSLGNIIGKGNLSAQTKQVFENLQIILTAAGASFNDVIKLNYYVVNYQPAHVQLIREIRAQYLPANNKPASTLVGVQALFNPDVLIEVEAIAVVNKKKKKSNK